MSSTASTTNAQIFMRVPSFLLWTYPTRYRPVAALPDIVRLCAFALDAETRTVRRLLNTTATVTPGSYSLSGGEQGDYPFVFLRRESNTARHPRRDPRSGGRSCIGRLWVG